MDIIGLFVTLWTNVVIAEVAVISLSCDWVHKALITLVTVMNKAVFIKRLLSNATFPVTSKILFGMWCPIVKLYWFDHLICTSIMCLMKTWMLTIFVDIMLLFSMRGNFLRRVACNFPRFKLKNKFEKFCYLFFRNWI